RLFDSSIGVDCRSHPGISSAQQPACILHRTHPCLLQMLRVRATIAVPTVIRDVHKNLRTIFCELTYFVRKDGFVTDKYAQPFVACRQRRARSSARELANFFGQSAGEPKPFFERQVLAEWDQ